MHLRDRLTIYVEFDRRSKTLSWHAVELLAGGASDLFDDDTSTSSSATSDLSASFAAWLEERMAAG